MCLEGALFRAKCPLLGGVTMNSSPSGKVSKSSALSSLTVISVTELSQTWRPQRNNNYCKRVLCEAEFILRGRFVKHVIFLIWDLYSITK